MICETCGIEYNSKYNSKTCSIECRKEYRKKYARKYYRKYYHDNNILEKQQIYKEENKGKVQEWQRNNHEKYKLDGTIKNYNKIKSDKKFNNQYNETQIKLFEELSDRQQFMDAINKEKTCHICLGGGKMVLHHIQYEPQETITLCYKCHAYLHHRFLERKRCQIYIT
jgi:hypothetical protein